MEELSENLCTHIMQMFIVDISNSVALPIGCFQRPNTRTSTEFASEKIKDIIDYLREIGLCLLGAISDCDIDAQSIKSKFHSKERPFFYIFDTNHILKSCRNQLLNKNVQIKGKNISMQTIVNLALNHEIILS